MSKGLLSPRLFRRGLCALALASFFAGMFSACGRADFETGAALYRKGRTAEAVAVLGKALLDYSMKERFSAPFPRRAEGFLYHPRKNRIRAVFPEEFTIKDVSNFDCAAYGAAQERLALGREGRIAVYTDGGRELAARECLSGPGAMVRGLGWADDDLLHHCNGRLYRCSADLEGCTPLAESESFPPPFSGGRYTVRLCSRGGLLVLVVGAAGQYNLSAVDLARGAVVFKNKQAASSKLLLHDKHIYYISGGSGAWSLCRLSWDGRERREIAAFPSLVEIEIFPEGVVFEDKKGVCIKEYSAKIMRLPFSYALHGGIGGYGLIEHRGALHVIEARRFFRGIERLRAMLPELFERRAED